MVNLVIRLVSEEGVDAGTTVDISENVTPQELNIVLNSLKDEEEPRPYSFYLQDTEITSTLASAVKSSMTADGAQMATEQTLTIQYKPQAVFRVRPVGRLACDLPGHKDAVLCVAVSPSGRLAASGSGDKTIIVWDLLSGTPKYTLRGHRSHVLRLSFSPDGTRLASGSRDAEVRIWDPINNKPLLTKPLKGHKQFVSSMAWCPYNVDPQCRKLVTGSKDGSARIWDVVTGRCLMILAGHSKCVTDVAWGGTDRVYTSSEDRTVRVWDPNTGLKLMTLTGHGHWVNALCLSTHHVLQQGAFHRGRKDVGEGETLSPEEHARRERGKMLSTAQERYAAVAGSEGERESVVTCSDDMTLHLYRPVTNGVEPVARMTGHQQLVCHVAVSPDGEYIASAGFDNAVRLWSGRTGKFVGTLRGHVGRVYRVAFSPDSRLLISCSSDSTAKVWNVAKGKLAKDLPGHADEVYDVAWSGDGGTVLTCSKDKLVKVWRH
ncbi:hypothetical protein KIPB_000389 [Kipferlia bialata]|uniref:NLE domain-containing protein n=1 Tax=Kipferlia bialata TaxID=797122 RepID=A0A9K3GEG5_9EUKA|nr:hypothetical protein KIPB_000389 [Kipferlia bialata]|eukprot:g389.t1